MTRLLALTFLLHGVSALYRLDFRPTSTIDLLTNIEQTVDYMTYDCPATVAIASRSMYRSEMSEMIRRKMVIVGPEVSEGVGSDFDHCIPDNELKSPRFVDPAEISHSCHPSNLFRSACFTSWSAHFKLISLPIFMDTSNNSYLISPSGAKIPAVENYYHSEDGHSLVITNIPRRIEKRVTLNCFSNHADIACTDTSSGRFSRMDIPAPSDAEPQDYVNCRHTYCWRFPVQFFRTMRNHRKDVQTAHDTATKAHSLRRRRATTPHDPNSDAVWTINWPVYTGNVPVVPLPPAVPASPAFPQPRPAVPIPPSGPEPRPTDSASVADMEELQDRLHALYQAHLYKSAVLANAVAELQRILYHTTLSLAKLDDHLLAHIWQQSSSTHFVKYDTFTAKPAPVHKVRNQTHIFVAGRYVTKHKEEECVAWKDSEVAVVPLFANHHLVLPSASSIRHTPTSRLQLDSPAPEAFGARRRCRFACPRWCAPDWPG
ncbi:hypothetical protein ONE63_008110 [Megalurothrips usitatus]|uniref:Uncharacterized protein n=1 Tax=Megalurothrips usitatus TaxID=439358 RepID=A0AAV7XS01_9NEOP|nr:hypothetical protein ONE63_008110 [Megalurothrips usitatus]